MHKSNVQYLIFIVVVITLFSSCRSSQLTKGQLYDPEEVGFLSSQLGIELNNKDKDDDRNMALYAETSLWLNVPYRYGGITRRGVDCSGFAYLMYQKIYGITIPRSTAELSKMKMKKVSRHNLKPGDLVFFATSRDKSKITHVGIYLKNGKFIHASTKRGVVVDDLTMDYYKKCWKKAGRYK